MIRQQRIRRAVEVLEGRLCLSATGLLTDTPLVEPQTLGDDRVCLVSSEVLDAQAVSPGKMDLKGKTIMHNALDNGHGTHVAGTIAAVPNHAASAENVDNVFEQFGVDGDSTDNRSATGTHYFDGRFLRADDLIREQSAASGGHGVDLLVGGSGQDAIDPSAPVHYEYKYVTVRTSSIGSGDLADWQSNYGTGG